MKEISTKEAFNNFRPESCVFVISVDKDNNPNGMVAGWNMKCSSDPPLFAVALSKKGNTHRLIQQSKEFVIAVPNKELEREVNFFGSQKGKEINKFEATEIETLKAKFVKTPLLKRATFNFECRLFKEVDVGDHIVFIGKILVAYWDEGKKVLFNMGKIGNKRIFEEF